LKINIKVSWWLAGTLVFLHIGAALVVARLPPPLSITCLLAGTLIASLVFAVRRHVLRADRSKSLLNLEIRPDGTAAIQRRDAADWIECEARDAFVHPWLVILQIAEDRRSERIVLPGDSISRNDFRKLRSWLRWRRSGAGVSQEGDKTVSVGGRFSSARG
jgi:hypothetical protein